MNTDPTRHAKLTHSERCSREATRDVIFLFQRRVRTFIYMPDGFDHDSDGWNRVDDDGEIISEDLVSEDEVAASDSESYIDIWETEGVWLDRDEAEAWGESHAYRFENQKKGVGWRVYGMPSYGDLAKLLQKQDESTP
jgi:hypothetical protein